MSQSLWTVDGRTVVDLPGFAQRTMQRADGGRLHYVQGPANGPPLVLLPGLLDPWHGYAASAMTLAQRFEVLLVSLRGHGPSSPASNGRYRVGDYGDDIAVLIEQAIGAPAFVAGNSLGGLIALWLASHRPDRVRAVCLEDAPLFVTEAPRWQSHWMRDAFFHLVGAIDANLAAGGDATTLADRIAGVPMVRPKVHKQWIDRVSTMAAILDRFGVDAMPELAPLLEPGWRLYVEHGGQPTFGAFYPREVAEQLAGLLQVVDVQAARETVEGRLNEDFDHAEALGRVRCPMLVMEADRLLSGIVDSADFARACRFAPSEGRHLYAAGAGHQIQVDRPLWFAEQLAFFFLDSTLPSLEPIT